MTSTRPRPLTRNHFHAFRTLQTRWMDMDVYGHINNVEYLSFFDTAVNSWYIEQGLLSPGQSKNIFLVVETSCHYFAELTFPQTIDAGLCIEKIGHSSVIYTLGLFKEQCDMAAAQGRFVHVLVDRTTRQPVEISTSMRSKLQLLTGF